MNLKEYIRNVPDFPKPGIMFRDITPLLSAPAAFQYAIKQFADRFRDAKPTAILAAESRGFIFAAPLAIELGAAFVPVRKPGKLPLKPANFSMTWNTAATHWKCMSMRSSQEVVCC